LFQLFATGVNDTGGKFATGVVDTGGNLPPAANLPPVSTTQGNWWQSFAAGVVDTDGNLPPVSLTPVANLPHGAP
jgi:hypothetical protein